MLLCTPCRRSLYVLRRARMPFGMPPFRLAIAAPAKLPITSSAPAGGSHPRHEVAFAYGGLLFGEGLRVVGVDASCPVYGRNAAEFARVGGSAEGGLRVAAVNTIPITDDAQLLFLLDSLPSVDSVSVEVSAVGTDGGAVGTDGGAVGTDGGAVGTDGGAVGTTRPLRSPRHGRGAPQGMASLVADYVAGSVLAADVAAACHSFDSEAQRVLLNADVDHRVHRTLVRTVAAHTAARGRSGGDVPPLAATLALVAGLLLEAGSAFTLRPIRDGVYVPMLRDLGDAASRCDDDEGDRAAAAALEAFVSAVSQPNGSAVGSADGDECAVVMAAVHTLLAALIDGGGERAARKGRAFRAWRVPSLGCTVIARRSEGVAWPVTAASSPVVFPDQGLVCTVPFPQTEAA